MAAPKGNKFWECRAKHGRNGIWQDPEKLWQDCVGYFEWVEANPLWESKAFNVQGDVTDHPLPKMRAMTMDGLCIHLGISIQTWHNYKAREDFLEVSTRVEQIIRDQKFAGAAADLLNANIIARDLGLKDAQEIKHSGHMSYSDLSDDELERKIQELRQAHEQSAKD